MIEFPPPSNLDAEASVLSALILDPPRIADVDRLLKPSDFFSYANRKIYETIMQLDAEQNQIDITTLAMRLRAQDRLESIGGLPYLAQILNATPAVAHAAQHARIVAELARVRHVQALCTLIRQEGYGEQADVESWLQSVEQRTFEATRLVQTEDTLVHLHVVLQDELEQLQARMQHRREITGAATGIPKLDGILGGLHDGCLYVIGGRPGHGKSGLVLQFALSIAKIGSTVAFISLEMPRSQLGQRVLAQAASLPVDTIRKGPSTIREKSTESSEWERLTEAREVIGQLPIQIDDAGQQTVSTIRSSVRRTVARHGVGIKLGAVIVDYLQLVDGQRQRGESRETEVARVSNGMRALAKEFHCPVILCSQLNRESARKNEEPRLEDLRESGAIEQDAYAVIFCHRPDAHKPTSEQTREARLIVAKHRNGSTGVIECVFDTSTKFYEVTDSYL